MSFEDTKEEKKGVLRRGGRLEKSADTMHNENNNKNNTPEEIRLRTFCFLYVCS